MHLTKLHKIDFSNKLGKNYDNVVINKSFSMLFSVLINERAHTVAHFDKLAYIAGELNNFAANCKQTSYWSFICQNSESSIEVPTPVCS